VSRSAAGQYTVTCNRTLPNTLDIVNCLPPRLQRIRSVMDYARYGESIQSICTVAGSSISNDQWAVAISKAIKLAEAKDTPAEVEITDFKESFVVMGGLIYRLHPEECVHTNKLLVTARRTLMDATKAEAKSILDSASRNAKALITKAKAELTAAQAERKNKLVAPAWMTENHLPILHKHFNASGADMWCVGFLFHYKPKTVTYDHWTDDGNKEKRVWTVNTDTPSIPHMVWLPISSSGSFAVTMSFLDSGSNELPHLSTSKGCMAPADAPTSINNLRDYLHAVESITRCLNGDIYLPSLLTRIRDWHPTVQSYLPTDVLAQINSVGINGGLMTLKTGKHEKIIIKKEASATWTS